MRLIADIMEALLVFVAYLIAFVALVVVGLASILIINDHLHLDDRFPKYQTPTYYDGEGNELSHHEVDSIVRCAFVVCDPKNY